MPRSWPWRLRPRAKAALDIGCGTGTTTMALAAAVGASGRVMGMDVSKPMLALAKSRGVDVAHLSFELADASMHVFARTMICCSRAWA